MSKPLRKMRVAHVLRKYDPREWGGTETAMCQLLDGLRGHGVESVVYCPKIGAVQCADPLAASGHPVLRYGAFMPVSGISREQRQQLVAVGGNLMSLDLIIRLLFAPGLSLIHVHTLGRLAGIARMVARWRRIPVVATIHGGVLDLPEEAKQKLLALSQGGWEWGRVFGLLLRARTVLEDVDAVITLNPREAELLREKYPRQRVVVMPHGIPMAAYEVDHRKAARAAFPGIEGRRVLLVLGRIDPVKNQDWLVQQAPEILRRAPGALLVFVGAATDHDYEMKLREHIEQLGLSDNVLLTGGLPPRDPRLIGLLQLAAVVIVPSVSETFGLVILEAWSAGAAVIASDTSGARQVIRHGENGWMFDLAAPDSFHSALSAALADPAATARMTEAGRRRVRDEYDNAAVTARVRDLYATLIDRTRGCNPLSGNPLSSSEKRR